MKTSTGKSSSACALGVLVIAASLGLAFLATGCGLQPGSATISYFHNQDPAPPAVAVKSGVYALYAFNSPNPLYTAVLKQGDSYGFRRDSSGKIVAFAPVKGQDVEIPLQNFMTTSYEWRYRKQ